MLISNRLYIIIITLVILAVSVILHEVVHGLVAKQLGDDTAEKEGRLTLNPLKHIDPITTVLLPIILAVSGQPIFGAAKPVPVIRNKLKWDEFGMALVAIAGPLTNLLLAVVGGLVLRFFTIDSVAWITWWAYFVQINIGFFIFNMIPLPPLDGSRVLYAFAPEFLQDIMDRIEPYGIFLILALVLLGMPLLGPVLSDLYTSIFNILTGANL